MQINLKFFLLSLLMYIFVKLNKPPDTWILDTRAVCVNQYVYVLILLSSRILY